MATGDLKSCGVQSGHQYGLERYGSIPQQFPGISEERNLKEKIAGQVGVTSDYGLFSKNKRDPKLEKRGVLSMHI